MTKSNNFVFVLLFLWLFTLFIASIKIDNDNIKIKRLERETDKLQQDILDYKWQQEQYVEMYSKYCGCDNK